MNRTRTLVLLCSITVIVAGCSKSGPVTPSATVTPSLAASNPAPVIQPYTGGPTSAPDGVMNIDGNGRAHQPVARPVNLHGIVRSLSGNTAAFTFKVGMREVRGDRQTEFFGRSGFRDLANNVRVNVKGLRRDGVVYARRIHVRAKGDHGKDDDPDDGEEDDDGSEEGQTPEPAPSTPPTPVAGFNPDPVQGLGPCQSYTCGFMFTALKNISIQALGQWDENLDGLASDAPVGLWSLDGSLIASAVVPSGTSSTLTGGYRYAAIAPVQLVAGQQYVIASAMSSSGAPTFSPAGLAPAIAAGEGRFILRGAGVLAFPTSPNTALYGGGNFLFVPITP